MNKTGDLERQVEDLMDQIGELQDELSELRETYDGLVKERNELAAKIAKVQERAEDLFEELSQ